MWHCPQCDAEGDVAFVEEDMRCPRCGERLQRVSGEPAAEFPPQRRPRLSPDRSLRVRQGRPRLEFKRRWLARLCVVLFHPIVCLCLTVRQRRMETRVNEIIDEISGCRNRGEVEQLLGTPVYAVGGEVCGLNPGEAPDLIECYEVRGCCIDLWFKDDRLVDISGFVKPTVWDSALTSS